MKIQEINKVSESVSIGLLFVCGNDLSVASIVINRVRRAIKTKLKEGGMKDPIPQDHGERVKLVMKKNPEYAQMRVSKYDEDDLMCTDGKGNTWLFCGDTGEKMGLIEKEEK